LKNTALRPYFALAIGLIGIASSSILIRFAQQEHAPSLVISAWRVAVATLVLTPLVLSRYRDELSKLSRTDILLTALSGIMLSFHFASWITSLEYTSVINSVVLVNTHPLWVAMATPFLLHERLSKVTLIAMVIALGGTLLVSLAGDAGTAVKQGNAMLGNGLAVIGALCVAAYYLIGRRVRARVSVISYIWLTYGTSALSLIIIVLLTGQQVTGLSSNSYIWMTLVGLIPQLIGHSAYNYALGYLSAAYVSLTVLGDPIVSAILAAIFLDERPQVLQIIGGVLILIALGIASREESQQARKLVQEDEIENAAL
jgi:drug/metabolite transporter (DMT)-like permease